MIGPVLQQWRALRLRLWAGRARLRLRRLGMRAEFAFGPGVRYETLPLLEVDAYSPASGGGTLRVEVGRDARLGRQLTVDVKLGGDNVLRIGERTVVQSWCRLQLHGGTIDIGSGVHVRDFVQLKTKSTLTVGDRVLIARDAIVHATGGVAIGEDCGIGERTTIIDSDHQIDGSGGAYLLAPLRVDPIVLGRGVALGANCVILRGSRLGDGASLAAGAVLNGDAVPDGHLAGGVPARVLKDLRA